MNYFLVVMMLFAIGFSLNCCSHKQNMYLGLSERDQFIYSFINSEGKKLEKKYNLSQNSTGIGGIDKLSQFSISFQRDGSPQTKEDARRLIVSCLDDFLNAINKDEKLRPYLDVYPFTAKNIDMTIFYRNKEGEEYMDPWMGFVGNNEGKIGYFTWTRNKHLQIQNEKYETFDEAVAILKKEKENPKSI